MILNEYKYVEYICVFFDFRNILLMCFELYVFLKYGCLMFEI